MSRNPLIEAIHEARYDLETCPAQDQAAYRKKLDDLVAQAESRKAFGPDPEWERFEAAMARRSVPKPEHD